MIKLLLLLSLCLIFVTGCKKDSPSATTAGASVPSCGAFILNSQIETTLTGITVTTTGNCGEEVTVTGAVLSGQSSVTGYRMINPSIAYASGTVDGFANPRFQTQTGMDSFAYTPTPVDNSACQAAHSVDGLTEYDQFSGQIGTSDDLIVEYDSNCNPQVRGYFRSYIRCTNGSEITTCSGTILLTK